MFDFIYRHLNAKETEAEVCRLRAKLLNAFDDMRRITDENKSARIKAIGLLEENRKEVCRLRAKYNRALDRVTCEIDACKRMAIKTIGLLEENRKLRIKVSDLQNRNDALNSYINRTLRKRRE